MTGSEIWGKFQKSSLHVSVSLSEKPKTKLPDLEAPYLL